MEAWIWGLVGLGDVVPQANVNFSFEICKIRKNFMAIVWWVKMRYLWVELQGVVTFRVAPTL